jgi:hypothetical protein
LPKDGLTQATENHPHHHGHDRHDAELSAHKCPLCHVGPEFDNATRALLASTGAELWSIDPTTGIGTYLSTFQSSGESFNDLVLLPTCP